MCVYNLLITIPIIPISIYSATSDDVSNVGVVVFESLKASNCVGYGMSLTVLSVTRYIKTFRPKENVLQSSKKAFLVSGLIAVVMLCLQCGFFKFHRVSHILSITNCVIFFVLMTLTLPIYIIVWHHLWKILKEWDQMRRNGEHSIRRHESVSGCFKNTVYPTTADQSHSNGLPKQRRETFVRQDTNSHINFIEPTYADRVSEFDNTGNENDDDNGRRFYLCSCKKSAKATYIFFCLTISFFIFQSIFWITFFLRPVWMATNISIKVLLDIRLFSASIDPILYMIMNSTYRQKLKDFVRRS